MLHHQIFRDRDLACASYNAATCASPTNSSVSVILANAFANMPMLQSLYAAFDRFLKPPLRVTDGFNFHQCVKGREHHTATARGIKWPFITEINVCKEWFAYWRRYKPCLCFIPLLKFKPITETFQKIASLPWTILQPRYLLICR